MSRLAPRSGLFKVATAVLLALIVISVVAVVIPTPQASEIQLDQRFAGPGEAGMFGSDQLGRDILTRVLQGGAISLGIGFLVTIISLIIGTTLGVISGYAGGALDMIFVWLFDTFISIPGLLMAIAFVAVLGPGMINIIVALSIMGWVGFARLARAMTLRVRNEEYIAAARSTGISTGRVIGVHLLPNIAGPLLVQAAIAMAGVIIVESTLSFLGLAGDTDLPSWGGMLNDGIGYILVAPHLTIFPGVAIMMAVLSLNIISDGLRDRLDPRSLQQRVD